MSTDCEPASNVKRKRGNVVIDLRGIAANTSEHTPTPTRFIRNCEEVGLFQDLQNVNPFEEGFRNALTGDCMPKTKPASDDTLHTPNVFPHIISVCTVADGSSSQAEALPINNAEDLENKTKKDATTTPVESMQSQSKSKDKSVVNKEKVKTLIKTDVKYAQYRRERNRISSQTKRTKNKRSLEEMREYINHLERTNSYLTRNNVELQREVKNLKRHLRQVVTNIVQTPLEESNMLRNSTCRSINSSECKLYKSRVQSTPVAIAPRPILPKGTPLTPIIKIARTPFVNNNQQPKTVVLRVLNPTAYTLVTSTPIANVAQDKCTEPDSTL